MDDGTVGGPLDALEEDTPLVLPENEFVMLLVLRD